MDSRIEEDRIRHLKRGTSEMRCEDVQEILDQREMGEIASAPVEVDGHLKACSDCAEFAADLQFAASSFAAVPMERFSEAKSRDLMAKITALEIERAEETEEAPGGFLASIFESMARLVAGPRLAYGLGAAAVMLFAISQLQSPHAPDTVELAQAPVQTAPVAPLAPSAILPPLKRHPVELSSGQILLSGILVGGSGRTSRIDLPEGKSVTTLGKQSAVLQLADGTRVAMGGSTSVSLAERMLYLEGGQVGVHVQKGGQGFKTVAPRLTTFVMGTRYIAGQSGVELVEGKVEVSGPTGKAVLKPGEKASAAVGQVDVKPIGQTRIRDLYNFFGNLDGREGLAKDLGMTVAQLDATIEPPVPTVAAPPTRPPVVPIRTGGPVRVTPGAFTPLPEPEPTDVSPAEEKPADGAKTDAPK